MTDLPQEICVTHFQLSHDGTHPPIPAPFPVSMSMMVVMMMMMVSGDIDNDDGDNDDAENRDVFLLCFPASLSSALDSCAQ